MLTRTPTASPTLSGLVVHGLTIGFWRNVNGHATLDADGNGAIDSGPYGVGTSTGGARGASVGSVAQSDRILDGGNESFGALAGNGLSDPKLKEAQVGNLAAQTLALTYNTAAALPPSDAFNTQTLAQLGCSVPGSLVGGPGPSLTGSSTAIDVLAKANSLLAQSVAGGTSTVSQVTGMTGLLGQCVNQEAALGSAATPWDGLGGVFSALAGLLPRWGS